MIASTVYMGIDVLPNLMESSYQLSGEHLRSRHSGQISGKPPSMGTNLRKCTRSSSKM